MKWGSKSARAVRTTLLAAALAAGSSRLEAQASTAGMVAGSVRESEGGAAVAGAEVFLSASRRTTTDTAGRFVLRGVAAGRHLVRVARIGYAPARAEVTVAPGGSATVNITLERTVLTIDGVQVTATLGGSDPQAVTQSMSQLSGRALEREMGATLAQTLQTQPGVAVRSMGPAASMPVMRGLTGDRILVLQDGQRTADLSGSADDHGVTIDPLTAQRVEIVRGPATLLYGNNALGGVVNVISGDIPTQVPLASEWLASGQSESAYPGGSAAVKGTHSLGGPWVLTFRGGGRSTNDMRIGGDPVLGDRLENTRMRNASGSVGLGYVGELGSAGAALKGYDFSYGLPVPPGSAPVSLRGRRYETAARGELALARWGLSALRADATAQGYSHDELDDDSGSVLQTFELRTAVANLLARQAPVGPLAEGAWGVSGLMKDYSATGPAALTPAATSRGVGAFGYQELPLGNGGPIVQAGARFDDYRIESRTAEKFGPGRNRAFRAASWSLGVRQPLPGGASASASVARSFRAPTVEELFSNAAHAGTGSVELGNPDLEPERGLSLEMVLRLQTGRWNGQLAGYRNRIDDYVFLQARGDTTLYGVTMPVLSYAQEEAVLVGAEGSLEFAASRSLVLSAMGDHVRATQASGLPLSFMPPARGGVAARWDDGTLALGADVHHEFRQDRTGAASERPTPAHTIVRLNAGVRFRAGGVLHSVTLRGENLTNELHREATSRIKDFAPGAGRNIALLYRVIF